MARISTLCVTSRRSKNGLLLPVGRLSPLVGMARLPTSFNPAAGSLSEVVNPALGNLAGRPELTSRRI